MFMKHSGMSTMASHTGGCSRLENLETRLNVLDAVTQESKIYPTQRHLSDVSLQQRILGDF